LISRILLSEVEKAIRRDDFDGFTRISGGQTATAQELAEDWTMAHELTHIGIGSDKGTIGISPHAPLAAVRTSITREMKCNPPKSISNCRDPEPSRSC
jgi:hypothetical protein